jgi:FAD/FMN-containing dehydrogenase
VVGSIHRRLRPVGGAGLQQDAADVVGGQDRVRATDGPNYQRLAEIKAEYDPHNVFRINQNIEPAR